MLFDEADKSLHCELMSLVECVHRKVVYERGASDREMRLAVIAMTEMAGRIIAAIPDNDRGREFAAWLAELHPYDAAE